LSNLIESRDRPVFKHLDRCIVQYEKSVNAALQRLKDDALFGVAIDGTVEDLDAVREAIDGYIRQRRATDINSISTIRRDIHLAYTRRLAAPVRPRHLRHKPYPRWSKE